MCVAWEGLRIQGHLLKDLKAFLVVQQQSREFPGPLDGLQKIVDLLVQVQLDGRGANVNNVQDGLGGGFWVHLGRCGQGTFTSRLGSRLNGYRHGSGEGLDGLSRGAVVARLGANEAIGMSNVASVFFYIWARNLAVTEQVAGQRPKFGEGTSTD